MEENTTSSNNNRPESMAEDDKTIQSNDKNVTHINGCLESTADDSKKSDEITRVVIINKKLNNIKKQFRSYVARLKHKSMLLVKKRFPENIGNKPTVIEPLNSKSPSVSDEPEVFLISESFKSNISLVHSTDVPKPTVSVTHDRTKSQSKQTHSAFSVLSETQNAAIQKKSKNNMVSHEPSQEKSESLLQFKEDQGKKVISYFKEDEFVFKLSQENVVVQKVPEPRSCIYINGLKRIFSKAKKSNKVFDKPSHNGGVEVTISISVFHDKRSSSTSSNKEESQTSLLKTPEFNDNSSRWSLDKTCSHIFSKEDDNQLINSNKPSLAKVNGNLCSSALNTSNPHLPVKVQRMYKDCTIASYHTLGDPNETVSSNKSSNKNVLNEKKSLLQNRSPSNDANKKESLTKTVKSTNDKNDNKPSEEVNNSFSKCSLNRTCPRTLSKEFEIQNALTTSKEDDIQNLHTESKEDEIQNAPAAAVQKEDNIQKFHNVSKEFKIQNADTTCKGDDFQNSHNQSKEYEIQNAHAIHKEDNIQNSHDVSKENEIQNEHTTSKENEIQNEHTTSKEDEIQNKHTTSKKDEIQNEHTTSKEENIQNEHTTSKEEEIQNEHTTCTEHEIQNCVFTKPVELNTVSNELSHEKVEDKFSESSLNRRCPTQEKLSYKKNTTASINNLGIPNGTVTSNSKTSHKSLLFKIKSLLYKKKQDVKNKLSNEVNDTSDKGQIFRTNSTIASFHTLEDPNELTLENKTPLINQSSNENINPDGAKENNELGKTNQDTELPNVGIGSSNPSIMSLMCTNKALNKTVSFDTKETYYDEICPDPAVSILRHSRSVSDVMLDRPPNCICCKSKPCECSEPSSKDKELKLCACSRKSHENRCINISTLAHNSDNFIEFLNELSEQMSRFRTFAHF